VTNKTKWWFVVHADEGLLSEPNTKSSYKQIGTMFHVFRLWREQYRSRISSPTVSGLSTAGAWQWMHCHLACQHILLHCPSNLPPSHLLLLSKLLTC